MPAAGSAGRAWRRASTTSRCPTGPTSCARACATSPATSAPARAAPTARRCGSCCRCARPAASRSTAPPCRRKKRRRCRPVQTFRNGAVVRVRLTRRRGPVRDGSSRCSRARARAGRSRRSPRCAPDADGRLSVHAGRGPSRTLRFQWAGTDTAKPACGGRAGARAGAHVDHGRPAQGAQRRGRDLQRPPARAAAAGRRQARRPAGQAARALAHVRGAAGRLGRALELPYRFEATRGLVAYSFRARIRREAAYPYELGHSRTVRVTVRG